MYATYGSNSKIDSLGNGVYSVTKQNGDVQYFVPSSDPESETGLAFYVGNGNEPPDINQFTSVKNAPGNAGEETNQTPPESTDYAIYDGNLIEISTNKNLGSPEDNGYTMNANGQWQDSQGNVAPILSNVNIAPITSPLAPGVDLGQAPSWLATDGTSGILGAIEAANKNLTTSGGVGSATGATGTAGTSTTGGGNVSPGSGAGSGNSGVSPGTGPGAEGAGQGTPTETTTEPTTLTTTEPGVIPSTLPTMPINIPIVAPGKTTSGTTTGLTAQQLAILATPTIFTPAAPTVDVGAPQVNLAGLVDQPAPVAQNNTSYAGYMPDLPDLGYLPYDYGGPQDAQAVTFASPNQTENTTMAATGGSVDDLLRIMNWRV